jgi:XTP/dITP diphosphohydrolase
MPELLLATGNGAKLYELRSLLQELPYKLIAPSEVGISTEVEETGISLEENASLKASLLASRSGLMALADDSGLEVDALGGKPGILSARYAGKNASDAERINYLLSQLEEVPWEERQARFRCVIALAIPDSQVKLFSGECQGFITFEPKGEGGFGYDPIFYLPRLDKTMAELNLEVKNRVSHRGKAVAKARRLLLNLLDIKNIQ